MEENVRKQLERRKYWLLYQKDKETGCPIIKYDKEDFKENWENVQKHIYDTLNLGLIDKDTLEKCNKVLYEYFPLCF